MYCFIYVCACIEGKARECALIILFCRTFANNQLQQKCYPCGIVDIVLNGNWRFEQAATTGLFRRSWVSMYCDC